jgi:Bardet-Biedl syndrome 9 protein
VLVQVHLECKVTICVGAGAPRVVTASFRLPLRLVAKPILPVKNATYKLTVDSNKPPVNLNDVFPGMTLFITSNNA